MTALLKTPQNLEKVDQFFAGLPSQKFLVNLLKIFPLIYAQMKTEFTHKHFKTLSRVLHAALAMPVSKDVSPFLVPSANENNMSTVQELTLGCVGVVFSKEFVFDEARGHSGDPKTLLTKKPHIVDVKKVLPVATDEAAASFYPLIVKELLKFSLLASEPPSFIKAMRGVSLSSLPIMNVNYVPFGLASQSLAVQLYRSCVQGGVRVPLNMAEVFLKVGRKREEE